VALDRAWDTFGRDPGGRADPETGNGHGHGDLSRRRRQAARDVDQLGRVGITATTRRSATAPVTRSIPQIRLHRYELLTATPIFS